MYCTQTLSVFIWGAQGIVKKQASIKETRLKQIPLKTNIHKLIKIPKNVCFFSYFTDSAQIFPLTDSWQQYFLINASILGFQTGKPTTEWLLQLMFTCCIVLITCLSWVSKTTGKLMHRITKHASAACRIYPVAVPINPTKRDSIIT